MPLTNYPSGVSSFGMPLVGGAGVATTGNVFFVSSVASGRSNSTAAGRDPSTPFATLDYAIGQCTASNNDVIYVMPGHVETIATAAGVAVDVAGIAIVGMGRGSLRPTMNFTATGSTFAITAANILITNILFTGGIDAIVTPITIAAADVELISIETRDVTGQAIDWITTTAAANRLHIRNWTHAGALLPGADTAISIVGGDGIDIENFRIFGNFAVAAIENVTTASTNLIIGGGDTVNYIQNSLDNAAVVAVTLVATATGFIGPNINIRIGQDATSNTTNITEALVGAAMQFMQPLNIANLGGEVAMQSNITAATDA